jgi:hypothetical protein
MPLLDEYFPFDIGNGSPANSSRWRKMAQLWQSDGVFAGYLSQLNATLAGTTVTVQTGGLFIHGYYGEVQNPQAITGVGTNGTVVAGVNFSTQEITIYYRDQVIDYGTNPATGYEQDTNIWEIPLWLVSGTTLIDLRTMLNPGAGCSWWANAAGPITVNSVQTVNTNFMTLRVPYGGTALIRGEVLVNFSDASQAQTAVCQLVYQQGASDQQLTPAIRPSIPGGGPAGQVVAVPLAISGSIPVTQGRKTLGWRVTAGTGPGLTLTTLTGSVQILNLPAAA